MSVRLGKIRILVAIVVIVSIPIGLTMWRSAIHRSLLIMNQANDSLKRDIDQELPAVSDRSQVVAFLNAHDIYTDGYRPLDDSYKAAYDGASAVIDANTKKVETTNMVCGIHMIFMFDANGKMLGHRNNVVCKGPF